MLAILTEAIKLVEIIPPTIVTELLLREGCIFSFFHMTGVYICSWFHFVFWLSFMQADADCNAAIKIDIKVSIIIIQ